MTDVLGRNAYGVLRPSQPTRLALETAADALTPLGRRDVVGKLVLVP